ncbi:MAG: transcriptional regulator [Thermoproteales archaeon]|nr:transcriptional regulator [Thermoproteales archaeon]
MISTLLRKDVINKIRESSERITWIDSLAVAAAALARSKAGMTVAAIADDIGRTEATIRRHLSGKSEAGKLVLGTYNKFIKEGVKIELPEFLSDKCKHLEEQLKAEKELREQLENKLKDVKRKLEDLIKSL